MEIYLVRHGETEWNAQGRFQGQMDSALTLKGCKQAHRIGGLLAEVVPRNVQAQIHASPLGRTQQTAVIIRQCRHYPSVICDARLQEVTTGSWDGLTHSGIDAAWPGWLHGSTEFDWYFRAPDGESYEAASSRVRAWLREVDGTVIAVSHGLLGRLIRGAYLDLSRAEALCLPVPQDMVWHLRNGEVGGIKA